jgi:hypothetical protein
LFIRKYYKIENEGTTPWMTQVIRLKDAFLLPQQFKAVSSNPNNLAN